MLPLIEKLPTWFKTKWSEKVMKLQNVKGKDTFPSFKQFVDEVCYQAQRMNIPQLLSSTATPKESRKVQDITKQLSRWVRKLPPPSAATALASSSALRTESKPIQPHSKERTTTLDSTSRTERIPSQLPSKEHSQTQNQRSKSTYCFYHNMNSHSTHECEQLNKLSFQERKELLRTRKVCFNCLVSDQHVAKNCSAPKLECKICQGKHSTVLHDPSKHHKNEQSPPKSDSTSNACSQVCGKFQPTRSCARIVLLQIFHSERPELRLPTYAVLDDQSSEVFITNSLLDELNAQYEDVTLQINTIVGKDSVRTRKVNGLRVQDIEGLYKPIKIQRAYTQDRIPADQSNIATPEVAIQWQHLNCIANQLHYSPNIEIGMLIGRNVPTAFQPLQVIYGKENEPWAEQYKFGWTIIGPVCLDNQRLGEGCEENEATVNKISVEGREPDNVLEGVPQFTTTRKLAENTATLSQSKDVTTPQQIKDMMQLDYLEVHHSRSVRGTETFESIEDQRFNRTLEEGIHVNDKGNWEMPLPFKTDEVKLPDNRTQCIKRLLSLKTKLLKKEQVRKDYTQFMQKIFDKGHATRVPEDQLKTAPGKVWYLPHFEVYHPKKPEQVRVVFDCSAVYQNESLNQHLLQGPDHLNALIGVLTRFRKEQTAVTCDIEQMFHSFYFNSEHRDYLRFLWYEDNNLEGRIVEYRMNVHLFGAASSPGVANFGLRKTAEITQNTYGEQVVNFLKKEFYVDDGLKSFPTPEEAIGTIKGAQSACASRNLRLHKFASNDKTVLESLPSEDGAKDLKNLDLRHDSLPVQRSLGTYWCIESDTLGFRIHLKDKPCTRRGILSTISAIYDPLGIVASVILQGKRILQDLCRDNFDWDQPVPDDIYMRWEKWRTQLPLLERVKVNRCFKPTDFGRPTLVQIHNYSDASDSGLGEVSYLRLENEQGRVSVAFLMAKARVPPIRPISIPRMELTAAIISVNVSSLLVKELNYENIREIFHTDSTAVFGYINNDVRRFHKYVGNRVQRIRDHSKPEQWCHVPGKENPADEASRGLSAKQLTENSRWLRGPDTLWQPGFTADKAQNVQLDPNDIEVRKTTQVLATSTQRKLLPRKPLDLGRFRSFSSLYRLKKSIALIQRMIERRRRIKEYNWRPHNGPLTVKELKEAEQTIIRVVQEDTFKDEIRALKQLEGNNDMFQERSQARARNLSIKPHSAIYRLDPFLDDQRLLRVGGRLHQAAMDYEVKHPVILPNNSHVTRLLIRQLHQAESHQGRGMTLNSIRQNGFWIINGRTTVAQFISSCITCRKLRARTQKQKMSNLPSERVTPAPPFTYTGIDVFGPFYIKEGRRELKRWGLIFTCLASRAVHLERLNKMDTDSFINGLRRFMCRRGKVRQLYSNQGTNFVGAKNEFLSALNENAVHSFTPNHLLNLKPRSVQSPPGIFSQPDVYSRKRWRRVQYLTEQFWQRWKREYCTLNSQRKKWNKVQRNFQVGDIVLLCEDDSPRIQWPLGRIIKVYPSSDQLVRKVQVLVLRNGRRTYLDRPIQKLVVIVEQEKREDR